MYRVPSLRPWTILFVPLMMVAFAAAQDETTGLRIEYSGSPDVAVVEYDVESTIGRTDRTPRLRIYGDGRVRVHRPAYMVTAGDYEMQFSDVELSSLLRMLHDNGAMSFDEKAVAEARKAAESAQASAARSSGQTLIHRTDAATTIVRIRLETYRESSASATQTGLFKEIRCADLQHEAEANPQISELRGMANVEDALAAIANDQRLRRVADAP